jgi:hypothetical protein
MEREWVTCKNAISSVAMQLIRLVLFAGDRIIVVNSSNLPTNMPGCAKKLAVLSSFLFMMNTSCVSIGLSVGTTDGV